MNRYRISCTADAEARIKALLSKIEDTEAEIVLEEGIYAFREGIILGEKHRDITIRGEGSVRLLGGQTLNAWKPVKGTPAAERFSPEAAEHILYCDLAAEGIRETGGFNSRGFQRVISLCHTELFSDGVPMNLSQYPKGDAFLKITAVPETVNMHDIPGAVEDLAGPLENGFLYDADAPKGWAKAEDIQVLGYWKYDWANSMEQVGLLDAEKGYVKTEPPYGNYGFLPGQRFRFYNIMEEVTDPGDFYVDRKANVAYIYPLREGAEISASVMENPIFRILGSKNIKLLDLDLECVRGNAVFMKDVTGCTVDRCSFRNIGNYAVDILGGKNNAVRNSTIHDCGDGGILCFAGNRTTLESADCEFTNNHIYRIAKWTKCYQPGILMIGVGMKATHNMVHDCPHTGIMFWGNEMTVEDNEIYSVVLETGDAGAVYTGRDYTFRGNSVSHNFIHHLGGVGMGTMGIYNDDAVSGTRMHNNYFMELTRGLMLGGGRKFDARNNVFVKCEPAIEFDSRCSQRADGWHRMCNVTLKERFHNIRSFPHCDLTTAEDEARRAETADMRADAMTSEYIRRYPELREIQNFYDSFPEGEAWIPGEAVVANNVFCSKPRYRYKVNGWPYQITENGKEVPFSRDLMLKILDENQDIWREPTSGHFGQLLQDSNMKAYAEDFTDPDWGDISVKADSTAWQYGYADGDFYSIGLQKALRRENPVTVHTTVQWTPGENAVRIGLRNKEAVAVCGKLTFHTSGEVKPETESLYFEVAPGEEKFYAVNAEGLRDASLFEVRSNVPGVRPARK
ncbi:MAG: right-handed parallel beta-helix repeat-containing protein [Oscillospiraceae bacterium]|nr:right-handed parallel beta-helix repeat-containing protein [Oscillospiraceae bacterium]